MSKLFLLYCNDETSRNSSQKNACIVAGDSVEHARQRAAEAASKTGETHVPDCWVAVELGTLGPSFPGYAGNPHGAVLFVRGNVTEPLRPSPGG